MYEIIKHESFYGLTCDFYKNEDETELFMTAEQLGTVLGYKIPRESINKLISRNPKLRTEKFSLEVKLTSTDGKAYNTRLFNEDGIYEVTFLSNTEKAEQFRDWVREILKSLRTQTLPLDTRLKKIEDELCGMKYHMEVMHNFLLSNIHDDVENKLHIESIEERLRKIQIEIEKNHFAKRLLKMD